MELTASAAARPADACAGDTVAGPAGAARGASRMLGWPLVEILDCPPEWARGGVRKPEDIVADEIGLIHPRWPPPGQE